MRKFIVAIVLASFFSTGAFSEVIPGKNDLRIETIFVRKGDQLHIGQKVDVWINKKLEPVSKSVGLKEGVYVSGPIEQEKIDKDEIVVENATVLSFDQLYVEQERKPHQEGMIPVGLYIDKKSQDKIRSVKNFGDFFLKPR